MPLWGWGCCTELSSRDGLDAAVAEAMAGGPPNAAEAFARHAAVAREHFLLPYDPRLAAHFPRTVGDAAGRLARSAAVAPETPEAWPSEAPGAAR